MPKKRSKIFVITQKKKTYPVGLICRLLGVTRSGFYSYQERQNSRSDPDSYYHQELIEAVKDIAKASGYRYGRRRMKKALNALNYPVRHSKAAQLMEDAGVTVKRRKKYKVTTNSNHQQPLFENVLNREFDVDKPDRAYVGDITCLWTQEGWLYLAVVIDLFSRRVVGWIMSSRMKSSLVCGALKMAVW